MMREETSHCCCNRRVRPGTLVCVGSLFAATVFAAAPRLNDYSQGIVIEPVSNQPLVETALPDEVYRTTTRKDLADTRVFNADGTAVPHAFCAAPEKAAPVISDLALPVFQLREAARHGNGAQIEVQTSSGTQVRVQQQDRGTGSDSAPSVHIIDARKAEGELRAIEFDWHSPDGASEARVRIQASEDLDRWTNVVAASTLVEVDEGGQQLRRKRVELPQRAYNYLRIERADGGPALEIESATAEHVSAGAEVEPLWFTAESVQSSEANTMSFDAGRIAPIEFARLRLPHDNSSVHFTLQSRPDENAEWRDRWRGESYSIVAESERRVSPPARFDAVADRYWRVQLPDDVDMQPALELAYRPVRLRFLTQGPGPYTLAFGSRRAEPVLTAQCDSLLTDVKAHDRASLIGEAFPGMARTLGGELALTPIPQKTPIRLIVLWGVLVVGVALLVAMALSLLRRLKTPEQ